MEGALLPPLALLYPLPGKLVLETLLRVFQPLADLVSQAPQLLLEQAVDVAYHLRRQ